MKVSQKSWIEIANEQVHIADVLASQGVRVPDSVRMGATKKVHCPFGFYHSDGGYSKAMRIYGSANSAYCFSCSKRYSPVTLSAAIWDCSWTSAAFRLLDDAGFKPKSLKERWVEATTPEENKPDLIVLSEALKMYCSGICNTWAVTQLDEVVADKLNKCLSLLNSVKTHDDADKWLQICKQVMSRVLTS